MTPKFRTIMVCSMYASFFNQQDITMPDTADNIHTEQKVVLPDSSAHDQTEMNANNILVLDLNAVDKKKIKFSMDKVRKPIQFKKCQEGLSYSSIF